MLTDMKVNITALRSLLYETSRMIDMYKGYKDLSKLRSLEKEERLEMKILKPARSKTLMVAS